jgi:hypothetical protein
MLSPLSPPLKKKKKRSLETGNSLPVLAERKMM